MYIHTYVYMYMHRIKNETLQKLSRGAGNENTTSCLLYISKAKVMYAFFTLLFLTCPSYFLFF